MLKFIILFSFFFTSLFAKDISFYEALDTTLKNNHQLKVKKLDIEKAKQDLRNVKGQELGQITLSENIAKSNNPLHAFGMKLGAREATFGDFGFSEFLTPLGGAISGAANGNQPGDMSGLLNTKPEALNNPGERTNYETKLVYQLPLFTGFKLSSAKDMTRLQVEAKEVQYKYDTKQLSLEVLKAYNGAVAAKYFIDATKNAKKATESFVEFATEMHKEGYTTTIDIDQAKVYDMQINSMLLEANNKYSLAIAYLKFLTNTDTFDDVSDFHMVSFENTSLEKLQETGLEKRDDLSSMDLNVQTMKKKVQYEKGNNYPTLGLHMEYGYNDNQLNNISSDKDYYVLGLGIQYKLFDGLTTQTTIEKSKIDYNKMKHYHQMMKDGIKLQIKKAYLTLKTKTSVLEEKIKAESLAKNVFEKSQQLYENQLIKMSDLLLEQANKQKAQAQTIMAKYEQSIAAANLKLAIGDSIQKDMK